jgi:hypothetical protein
MHTEFYFENLKGTEYLREVGSDGMKSGCLGMDWINLS